jgi:hypothetical protein
MDTTWIGRATSIERRVTLRYRSPIVLIAVVLACIDPSDATNPDYDPTEITVDVDIAGNGGGRATAPHPITINCVRSIGYGALGECRNTFIDAGGGGKFEIFMTADSLSTLAGWSGDCTGLTCELSFPGGRDTTFNVTARVILHAPIATITLPVEGAAYYADETVQFRGSATDAAGRMGVGFVSQEWTSSQDGLLCSGSLDCPPGSRVLSPGSHVITLTATDREGTTASTSVNIIVRDEVFNDPPSARIHSPDDGELFATGDNITFSGDGRDTEDGSTITNAGVWSSSLDGFIGTGGFLVRTLRSAGTHVISLAVADSEGKSDTARVTIRVTQAGAPGSIYGNVRSNGVPIEGATLDLYGGARATTTTDDAGSYSFSLLPAGNYTIVVSGVPNVTFPSPSQTVALAVGEATRVDFVSAANTPPVATITSPADGQSYVANMGIAFSGSAQDAEDGVLSGGALVWTSSIDGAIGTGASFSRPLSAGVHTIMLVATDMQGATGSASVDITVANANPTASISGRVTGNGYGIGGATLTLTGPVTATTTSGNDGSYSFGTLPAGTYTVSVSTSLNVNFPANPRTVTLVSGQALTVDFAGTY